MKILVQTLLTDRLFFAYLSPPSLPPLRVCCNALLAAYARAQPTQWLKAVRLLDLMWQVGGAGGGHQGGAS